MDDLGWSLYGTPWLQPVANSEGLSDTGDLTGRGSPFLRGSITGAGTFLGGILHTLPFLIPQYKAALVVAVITVALGGAIIAATSAAPGAAG
jgi:VIT1/CCC1 family predicted Fe2+/Mn2+ transporter